MFQPGIGRGLSLPMHVSTAIRRSPTSRISVWTEASACPFGARNGPSQSISARFSTVASADHEAQVGRLELLHARDAHVADLPAEQLVHRISIG